MKRLTEQRYRAIAERRGFKWLGPFVINANTKTGWRCSKGHTWQARYGGIHSGKGCPSCAGTLKLTVDAFRIIGARQGIEWAGVGNPPSCNTPTEWRCANRHSWRTSYSCIKAGRGCRICSGRKIAKAEDYQALAVDRGFKCIQPSRINHDKALWECSLGHQWRASYTQLVATKSGCPTCYKLITRAAQVDRQRKKPSDYHEMALSRGLRWLGPVVSRVKEKTRWGCGKDHQWSGTYDDLNNGQGCPECVDIVNGHKVSKPQRRLCLLLDGELNKKSGRYSIDVAFERQGIKIALEYDAWYWHAHREKEDQSRRQVLAQAGWRILRIKGGQSAIPDLRDLSIAIERLVSGEIEVEIEMTVWGIGPALRRAG